MPHQSISAVFAARLRAARKALGISQAELGIRMGLSEDVASTRINRYELKKSGASLDTMDEMARVLGVPLLALIATEDDVALINHLLVQVSVEDRQALLAILERKVGKQAAAEARTALDRATPAAPVKNSKRRTP